MPSFQGQSITIVLVGRQNPRILTHDFLTKNKVLPADEEPFRELLAKPEGSQFTEFISTPVLATIRYGPISIIVEENRYQIGDARFGDPASSPIVRITKVYFGELLKYTPLELGGVNLHGTIRFVDRADEDTFDRSMGLDRERVRRLAGTDDFRVGIAFTARWRNGTIAAEFAKPMDAAEPGRVNFNYQFSYDDIESFLANLDDAHLVYERFCTLLRSLGTEVRT